MFTANTDKSPFDLNMEPRIDDIKSNDLSRDFTVDELTCALK